MVRERRRYHTGDPDVCTMSCIRIQAPRGLSAEEKRVRLLEIFHESVSSPHFFRTLILLNYISLATERLLSGIFHAGLVLLTGSERMSRCNSQLKELEKLGPKLKGIGARFVA